MSAKKCFIAFPGNKKKCTTACLIALIHWLPLVQLHMGEKHGETRHSFGCALATEQQLKLPLARTDDMSPGEKPLRRSSCFAVASPSQALVILVGWGALPPASRAGKSLQVAHTCSEAHTRLQGLQALRDHKESIWPAFYLFHSPAPDIAQHMCARERKRLLHEKHAFFTGKCEWRKYIKICPYSTVTDSAKHDRSLWIVSADKNKLQITLQCSNTDSGVNSVNRVPVMSLHSMLR